MGLANQFHARPDRRNPGGSRRGSVIVVILALVTLAAFLLTGFVERSMTEMLVESRSRIAERLRVDAHTALEGTLAVLADYEVLDNGLRSPAQGWGEHLAELELPVRAGTTIEVAFEDETGRLSLPRLAAPTLEQLGVQIGLKPDEARVFTEALLVWTKATGTSSRYETDPRNYEYRDPPHHPPGRPLASFAELAAIAGVRELLFGPDGRPNELYERFTRAVSLFDFPAINLNTATTDALTLAGLDAGQSERLRALNSGAGPRPAGTPPYFRSVAEARILAGLTADLVGFDTRVHCLRVTVTVREGPTAFHLIAVVRPGRAAEPEATARTNAGPAGAAGATVATAATSTLGYPFTILDVEEQIELAPSPVS